MTRSCPSYLVANIGYFDVKLTLLNFILVYSNMSKCISIKSKREFFIQCTGKACQETGLCKKHQKYKKIIEFNPNTLNPFDSLNDTDPITLDKIYYEENGKKKLSKDIDPKYLFTYRIKIKDKLYQRTLVAKTIKSILDKQLPEPFTTVPFPENVILDAMKFLYNLGINKEKYRLVIEKELMINSIINKFKEIGYEIEFDWIYNLSETDYSLWYSEIINLWNEMYFTHIEVAKSIYPNENFPNFYYFDNNFIYKILKFYNEICTKNTMGIMLVLTSLAWVSNSVKESYPHLYL